MPVDIERPRWRATEACEVAGYDDPQIVRNLRADYGLRLGKLDTSRQWRFSALDIAQLTTLPVLRALGIDPASAIKLAQHELRPNLRDLLNNRLVHGFWSLGAIEVDVSFGKRMVYLDQIGERVISKLALPLPVDPFPRSPEVAVRMVDGIFDYFQSPSGIIRWRAWKEATVARGGRVSFEQAAAEIGAPAWFLRALVDVTHARAIADVRIVPPVAEAVRKIGPKIFDDFKAVRLR